MEKEKTANENDKEESPEKVRKILINKYIIVIRIRHIYQY